MSNPRHKLVTSIDCTRLVEATDGQGTCQLCAAAYYIMVLISVLVRTSPSQSYNATVLPPLQFTKIRNISFTRGSFLLGNRKSRA
jgi:hypothetical protein